MMQAMLFAGLLSAAVDAGPRIDLNTATIAELESLPGIGHKKAQAIAEFRKRRSFHRTSEIMRIKGIGTKLYLRLRPRLSVSPPLSAPAATRAEATAPAG